MKPTVVLVGRPNVGKSTLFNRLTRSRDALVANLPGLTRDRHYGQGRMGDKPFIVVDTGGFEPVNAEGIYSEMARQAREAIAEADVIIFVTDGRAGLSPQDKRISQQLREASAPVFLAVNKTEGMREEVVTAEFHELALGDPHAISAEHGEGVRDLVDLALAGFKAQAEEEEVPDHPRVAIIGRPNVGKSTLVNKLLGEERMIAFDKPGTTRDAIEVELDWEGRKYTLVDTAGIRRKGKVFEAVEKFSVVKTLQAIERAHVVVLVVDAQDNITEQDAHIAGYILEAGRALAVGVNKWDAVDADKRKDVKSELERKLQFLDFAEFTSISALKGTGIKALLGSVDVAFAAAMAKLSTPKLTRALQAAVEQQQPPMSGRFRPKMRYAHQGGSNPPIVVIHGSGLDGVKEPYKRYLENSFRKTFKLKGTPLRIELRSSVNPFEGRHKPLTEKQDSQRRRRKIISKRRYG
ncbi:MAG: ribosome biogenesis GTPase Der [Pseudomonadota bacterium]|nr:ribosome biogenesis GTPase Der [Pseudomonadota bacterium]